MITHALTNLAITFARHAQIPSASSSVIFLPILTKYQMNALLVLPSAHLAADIPMYADNVTNCYAKVVHAMKHVMPV